jgi:hypothetical protein
MRRTRWVAFTVAIAGLAIAAPAASADTIGGTANVTVVGGQVSFVVGGSSFSGYAQVEDDHLTGQRHLSWYFDPDAPGAERLCDADTPDDPSDDYVGNDFTEWFADQPRIQELVIKQSLSGAKLTLRATGPRTTYSACTGEPVSSVTETHALELILKASADLYTEVNVVRVDNGDGTTSPGLETFNYREQSSKVLVDGKPASGDGMSIQTVVVVRT